MRGRIQRPGQRTRLWGIVCELGFRVYGLAVGYMVISDAMLASRHVRLEVKFPYKVAG